MSLEPIEILSISLFVFWLIAFYIYWRLLANHVTTVFRSYDILFITILIGLVVTRVGGIMLERDIYLSSGYLSYLNMFDLNFDYLLLPYIPVLSYQFVMFNVEYKKDWSKVLPGVFLFGLVMIFSVLALQLARSIYFSWGTYHIVLHGGILLVTLVNALLMLLAIKGRIRIKNISIFIIVEAVSIILLSTATNIFVEDKLAWIVISQLIALFITIAPISNSTKTTRDENE